MTLRGQANTICRAAVALSCFCGSALFAQTEQQRFDCVIDPSRQVNLGSEVSGLLAEVLVDRGDPVEAGQVIARLTDGIEKANLALAQARAADQTEVTAQAARLDLAQQGMNRARELYEQSVTTLSSLEEREAAFQAAQRDLSEAKLRQVIAGLELERARVQLDQRAIRTPISGWVTARFLNPGEYVHSESKIVTVVDLDPLYVEAFVDTAFRDQIAEGMEARVFPSAGVAFDDAGLTARLTIIDRVSDASSDTFGVRLDLPNPDGSLPAGQRCQVAFPLPAQKE